MKAITLRDIPDSIAESIKQQSEINGTSLNKTVIDLLAKAVNSPQKRRQRFHDLDHLIGRWSIEESDEVTAEIDKQRVIDTELWR